MPVKLLKKAPLSRSPLLMRRRLGKNPRTPLMMSFSSTIRRRDLRKINHTEDKQKK
jgi:hypothetical protein